MVALGIRDPLLGPLDALGHMAITGHLDPVDTRQAR